MQNVMQQLERKCQSCGMPLANPELLGTDVKGNVIEEYCTYCYVNGEFTQPSFSVEDMVSFCVPFLVEEGMGEETARSILTGSLPHLKRWSSANGKANEQAYTIVQLEEFKLIGITATTTNEQEMGENAKIGALWARFWKEGIRQIIPSPEADPECIYGCYTDYENGAAGEYTILIGGKVSELTSVPEGMAATIIPSATYAVFTTRKGPITEVVVEAWQNIWRWAALGERKRTFTGDFELYNERSHDPDNAQVEIYIAIEAQ
jgi:predicted transcriptional regulator YdeE